MDLKHLPPSAAYAVGSNLVLLVALAVIGVQGSIGFTDVIGALVAANGVVLLIALRARKAGFARGWITGIAATIGGLALLAVIAFGLCTAVLQGA